MEPLFVADFLFSNRTSQVMCFVCAQDFLFYCLQEINHITTPLAPFTGRTENLRSVIISGHVDANGMMRWRFEWWENFNCIILLPGCYFHCHHSSSISTMENRIITVAIIATIKITDIINTVVQ